MSPNNELRSGSVVLSDSISGTCLHFGCKHMDTSVFNE